MPSADDVRQACETAVKTMRSDSGNAEVAFFGGSFTAIDHGVMISLLDAAEPFVREGKFKGIRVSTRPDAVDRHVLALLKDYGVTAVELGAQSMDDGVLEANERGHTSADVERASGEIHAAGLELGLQMMTGLYKSSDKTDIETAHRLAALDPATVRIYPTIVMEHTSLAALYRAGAYKPPELERAVDLCAQLLSYFEKEKGIKVIRLGLHSGSEMQARRLAGPWHPAFRELCENKLFLDAALLMLQCEMPGGGDATLLVNPVDVSRMTGQKRSNIDRLAQSGYNVKVKEKKLVLRGSIEIIRGKE